LCRLYHLLASMNAYLLRIVSYDAFSSSMPTVRRDLSEGKLGGIDERYSSFGEIAHLFRAGLPAKCRATRTAVQCWEDLHWKTSAPAGRPDGDLFESSDFGRKRWSRRAARSVRWRPEFNGGAGMGVRSFQRRAASPRFSDLYPLAVIEFFPGKTARCSSAKSPPATERALSGTCSMPLQAGTQVRCSTDKLKLKSRDASGSCASPKSILKQRSAGTGSSPARRGITARREGNPKSPKVLDVNRAESPASAARGLLTISGVVAGRGSHDKNLLGS